MVEKFEECHRLIVPPKGPNKCIMALIGQAPGEHEESAGEPFVGPSGSFLNTKLHMNGIARAECYIDNLSLVRPGTWYQHSGGVWDGEKYAKPKTQNDFSIFWKGTHPSKYLLHCREQLLQRLKSIQTKVIVCLGGDALWALTGYKEIGKYRGTAFRLDDGRYVIGTFHPANIYKPHKKMGPGAMGYVIQLDLRKAKKYASTTVHRLDRSLHIKPSYSEVLDFCERCYRSDKVAFDIETSPSYITCISLAYSKTQSMSIPLTPHYWGSIPLLKDVLCVIARVLTKPGLVKVGWNLSFDIQYMARFLGILPTKPWFDGMIAAHACYSELPKSLAFWTSILTDEPYYKDDLKLWREGQMSDDDLWIYNARDSAVTLEVVEHLEKEMLDLGVKHTCDFLLDLLEPLLFMMLRGIKIDKDVANFHKEEILNSLDEKESILTKRFGDINPRSSKQVAKLLYEDLGLEPQYKDGKITTGKAAIEKLAKKSPELKKILDVRSEKKLINDYVNVSTDAIDDRLRFSLNVTGTETFRLSASASVFNCGNNIQNWPHKMRDIVVPDEGMAFSEFDLAGADAAVVAYLSQDPVLIKLLEEGKNIHLFTATNILWPNFSEEDIKKDKRECERLGLDTKSKYFIAKKVRHSGNYLASFYSLMDTLECSAAQAKAYLAKFYARSPNLVVWHQELKHQLMKNRTIVTPLGTKRIFLGQMDVKLIREAAAFIPQETVTKVINIGLKRTYYELCREHKDIKIVNQVHDSFLVEHPLCETRLVHRKVKEYLAVPITIKGRTFKIPVTIKTGFNWKDLSEVKC